jgi:D-amino-acid dehydrogenase
VRAAGTAELGATTTDAPPERFRTLARVLRELYPDAAGLERPQYWAGLRPMTPDGPPILGPTPIGNLLLNVGHGSQGWSMACGSGRVLADLVSGRRPEIDLEGLTLGRYD